MIQVAP